jgi:hypothetical protein
LVDLLPANEQHLVSGPLWSTLNSMHHGPIRRARGIAAAILCIGAVLVASSPSVTAQAAAPTPIVVTTPSTLTPVRALVNPSFETTVVPPGTWTFLEAMNGSQSPKMAG